MRLGIHLYLGWYALFVIPWLVGAMLLWRCCPSVWPFVVGHGIYDVIQVSVTSTVARTTAIALLAVFPALATRCRAYRPSGLSCQATRGGWRCG